jgi:hypothetical protein
MIVVNQIRCKKCGDEPFSRTVHDFRYCKCGAVAVDGGQEYLRRVGNPSDMEEMSFSLNTEVMKACRDAVKWANENNRNEMGAAIAVLRALKNSGRLLDDWTLQKMEDQKDMDKVL